MNKFFVSILLAITFVIGLLPETATADPQSDMAALKQALERIGEGIPENPRQDRSPAHRGVYNVMEFGAKGDGIADDTQAIQNALNAAYYDGGGIVNMPTGAFLVKTHLTIPSNVTLEGVWRKPHWGQTDYSTKDLPKRMGTILLAVEGQGDPEGTPFITLGGRATDDTSGGFVPHVNAAISGLSIHYPEQIRANPPHAYPWTIRGTGDDCGIMNVNIMNCYQAVDFGSHPCGRHYVDGLYAYPFKTGIYVNACFDVGRLNNIHFWPFFDLDPNSPLWKYTRANGTAFRFGRTDGELVSNSFCIFYNIGAHLIGGPIRMNGPNEPARYEYQGGAAAFTNVYLDVATTAVGGRQYGKFRVQL